MLKLSESQLDGVGKKLFHVKKKIFSLMKCLLSGITFK